MACCLSEVSDRELLQEVSERVGIPAEKGEGIVTWATRCAALTADPRDLTISALYDDGQASWLLFCACRDIRTLGDATECTERSLEVLHRMSPKAVCQLSNLLESYGLSLRPFPADLYNPSDPKAVRVDDLATVGVVSRRTWECLRQAGIRTLGELSELTYADVMALYGVGSMIEGEIASAMGRYGLTYKTARVPQPTTNSTLEKAPAGLEDSVERQEKPMEETEERTSTLTGGWYAAYPDNHVEGPFRSVREIARSVSDAYGTAYSRESRRSKGGAVVVLEPIWGKAPVIHVGRMKALRACGLVEA